MVRGSVRNTVIRKRMKLIKKSNSPSHMLEAITAKDDEMQLQKLNRWKYNYGFQYMMTSVS